MERLKNAKVGDKHPEKTGVGRNQEYNKSTKQTEQPQSSRHRDMDKYITRERELKVEGRDDPLSMQC